MITWLKKNTYWFIIIFLCIASTMDSVTTIYIQNASDNGMQVYAYFEVHGKLELKKLVLWYYDDYGIVNVEESNWRSIVIHNGMKDPVSYIIAEDSIFAVLAVYTYFLQYHIEDVLHKLESWFEKHGIWKSKRWSHSTELEIKVVKYFCLALIFVSIGLLRLYCGINNYLEIQQVWASYNRHPFTP